MKICFRCHSEMVLVTLVDIWGQAYTAIACPECGRFYSRYKEFRGK